MPQLLGLPDLIAASHVARQLFDARVHEGRTVIPDAMQRWARERFGDLDSVRFQQIVRVRNRFTLEEALFNPLRARRPLDRAPGDLDQMIAERLATDDIFAQPLLYTTADSFGRIQGRFCVSASNVAKYDGWHGLVIFDEPHPLRFDAARVQDYLGVALRWLATAHAADPAARYPLIIWNCLPRSGASLVHGHMQMSLAYEQHYSRIEWLRRAALAFASVYSEASCGPYFEALLQAHADLGLACYEHQGVRGYVSVTPVRNREVVLVAPSAGEALALALHACLRALIERQAVRAFNACIYLPPLATTREDWQGFPVLARLVDRGDPLNASSDLGAVELFASNVLSADPYDAARALSDP
jgi:hypothetical protein